MVKLLALLILLIGLSVSVASEEDLRAQLLPASNDRLVLMPGDIFDGVIRVWPYYGKDPAFFTNLEGKVFLKHFYVANIEKMEFSKNNTDVLEIHAQIALKKEFEVTSFFLWQYKHLNVPVTLKRLASKTSKVTIKDYIFYDQNVPYSLRVNWTAVAGVGILLLFVWFYFRHKILRKRRRLQEQIRIEQEQKNKMIQTFSQAGSRQDIEEIMQKRKAWERYVDQKDPMVEEYLDWIVDNQYRRDWNDLDLQRMKKYSNEIGKRIQESNGV